MSEPRLVEYDGRRQWAVRWGEAGLPDKIRECGNEQEARELHAFLAKRYAEQDRADRPELLSAQVVWRLEKA